MAELAFIDELYESRGVNTPGIKDMLDRGFMIYGIYLLCVEASPRHLLEIFECSEVVKDFYNDRCYKVIGVANGKPAALELVRQVVADFISTGQSLDGLGNYLRGL